MKKKKLKKLEPFELIKRYVEAKTDSQEMYHVIPDNAITEAIAGIEQIFDFLDIKYKTDNE